MENLSLPLQFANTVKKYAQHTVINFMGKKTDFQTLDQFSDKVCAELQHNGIQKSDRVALYCVNSDAFVIWVLLKREQR